MWGGFGGASTAAYPPRAVGDAPQYPTLLNGYVTRPAWSVAGVDYYVGAASATVWKDPRTEPAGTGYNSSTKTLVIAADNVTLDGYDFTFDNGIAIYSSGNSNLVVNNCKFAGSNYGPLPVGIITVQGGSNLTVTNCTLDGNATANSTDQQTTIISSSGGGTTIIEHNWFLRAGQHIFECVTGQTISMKFNLIDNTPLTVDAHLNFQQLSDGAVSSDCSYNTSRQIDPKPSTVSGGEGFQFYHNGTGTLTFANCSNNTMVAPVDNGSNDMNTSFIRGSVGATGTTLTGPATANNNYVDVTGTLTPALGLFALGSCVSPWTASGNINMVTGATITPT